MIKTDDLKLREKNWHSDEKSDAQLHNLEFVTNFKFVHQIFKTIGSVGTKGSNYSPILSDQVRKSKTDFRFQLYGSRVP